MGWGGGIGMCIFSQWEIIFHFKLTPLNSPLEQLPEKGATSLEDVWKTVVDKVGGWD